MNSNAISLFQKRRTQYVLGKNLPISEEQLETLVHEAIRWAPSSYNSQSSRAIILFGAPSEHLWKGITKEILRPLTPAENWSVTDAKMDGFAAGAGTILFFEDQNVVKHMQEQFPLYKDAFPVFSEHSAGMAQFAVWTALAEVGVGASLQHYMPLIDEQVAKTWNVPASWKLRAQMPFGSNEALLPEKTFMDDELRFRTIR